MSHGTLLWLLTGADSLNPFVLQCERRYLLALSETLQKFLYLNNISQTGESGKF